MIARKGLKELVEAKHYGPNFVPLHVEKIEEYKSNLRITETGFNRDVTNELDQYLEQWQVREGTYLVTFEELVTLPEGVGATLYPSANALAVGTYPLPRMLTNEGKPWTLVSVSKSVDIDDDAVIALLSMYYYSYKSEDNGKVTRNEDAPEDKETDNDEE